MTGYEGTSGCWYNSTPMPSDFQLSQTVNGLDAGLYVVRCRLGVFSDRVTTQRLFANNNVTYYGPEADYRNNIVEGENYTFMGNVYGAAGGSKGQLREMAVKVILSEGDPLTLGIRTNNRWADGSQSTNTNAGWFKVDDFRLQYVGPMTAATMYEQLAAAHTECADRYATTTEGNSEGQFSASARAAFKQKIDAAQAALETYDANAMMFAYDALLLARKAYDAASFGTDATHFLQNPSFSKSTTINSGAPEGWQYTGGSPYTSKISNAEKGGGVIKGEQNHWQLWHSGALQGTCWQEVSGLSDGHYTLKATICPLNLTGIAYLFIGDSKTELKTGQNKEYSVETDVEGGTVRVGVTFNHTGGTFDLEMDDFTLSREDLPQPLPDMDMALARLQNALAEAQRLYDFCEIGDTRFETMIDTTWQMMMQAGAEQLATQCETVESATEGLLQKALALVTAESETLLATLNDKQLVTLAAELQAIMDENPTILATHDNVLKGRKMNVVGDSYVKNHQQSTSLTWHALAASRNGMTYRNYGINGNAVAWDRTSEGYGRAIIDRYTEMDADADMVVVMAGHNDAYIIRENVEQRLPIFKQALDSLLTGVRQLYPTAKIGYVTPWYQLEEKNFEPTVNAIIDICHQHHITLLNNYTAESPIKVRDELFRSMYFQATTDMAHLNKEGHELFYPTGLAFLQRMVTDPEEYIAVMRAAMLRMRAAIYNDDITIGISITAESDTLQHECYDLFGRRLARPQRGICIVDGRKVVVP